MTFKGPKEVGIHGNFSGSIPLAACEGIYKLDPQQILDDLDATVACARLLEVTDGKVAVAGFCWGGGKTFVYSAHNPDVAVAFVFMGVLPRLRS